MELQEAINYVKTFHESFGINNENSPKMDVGESVIKLRHSLMHEENEEYQYLFEYFLDLGPIFLEGE